MNEAVFPLIGPLLVLVVVLPISALLAKALLLLLDRVDSASGLTRDQGPRYSIVVASSAVPLSWFVSASLHQAERGETADICSAAHAPGALCAEAAYFSLALCVLAAAFAIPRFVRDQLVVGSSRTAESRIVQARIERILKEGHRLLVGLQRRIVVSDGARAPVETIGLFFPRVVVRTAFAQSLDDEALAAALHHELEHHSGRDPLRYFVASWALKVNPIGGWLLRQELARWSLAREAECDRQAVLSGASPLALAEALVVAARPNRGQFGPELGSGRIEAVRLRLGLLLAYAEQPPQPCHRRTRSWLLLLVLALVLALPHGAGTEPLDSVHQASESAALFLTGS